ISVPNLDLPHEALTLVGPIEGLHEHDHRLIADCDCLLLGQLNSGSLLDDCARKAGVAAEGNLESGRGVSLDALSDDLDLAVVIGPRNEGHVESAVDLDQLV
ncbi:MAG: hypothetical protein AAGF91_06805, partial [Actinomycetota bacterium]